MHPPQEAAALCIALLADGDYGALRGLSSVAVNERVDSLDSSAFHDKLHVYVSSSSLHLVAAKIKPPLTQVWGIRGDWELEHMRSAIHRFSTAAAPLPNTAQFRKLDQETLQAAVLFDVIDAPDLLVPRTANSRHNPVCASGNVMDRAAQAAAADHQVQDNNGFDHAKISTIVLLVLNVDTWEYHDIIVSLDWDEESKKRWHANIELARLAFEDIQSRNLDAQSISSDVDKAYWESYATEVKLGAKLGTSAETGQTGDDEDDYWDLYENSLSKF
ncbi:hypothetical protein HDU83_007601 [Entophlyctis luteolus]|nr:hypothetical protein HDU83_007601 [Entophlyctis luteolus]